MCVRFVEHEKKNQHDLTTDGCFDLSLVFRRTRYRDSYTVDVARIQLV